MARVWAEFRPAFARPGFITFKIPPNLKLPADFDLQSVFARSYGISLGKVIGESDQERAVAMKMLIGSQEFDELHVCQRGDRGSDLVTNAIGALCEGQEWQTLGFHEGALAARLVHTPQSNSKLPRVLDCVIVEPNEWWVGHHVADRSEASWPGGIYERLPPTEMVSRAYLKMDEALAWSELPVKPGEHVAEIGCAPGGASQALLERGLVVLGIDPANVDERIIANPNFTHIRKRGHEVRRREFRKTRWLTADLNVAPQYTLDTVEAIVTHEEVDVRGMLLTLKLLEWSLAEEIPNYLDRIRSWGYADVRAKQLSNNRQEICVAARKKATRD
jgi:23S rRNA (cytidine2498-2'-O)-methyltransferase